MKEPDRPSSSYSTRQSPDEIYVATPREKVRELPTIPKGVISGRVRACAEVQFDVPQVLLGRGASAYKYAYAELIKYHKPVVLVYFMHDMDCLRR